LAVDGGQLFAERRTAQNAADNAALAAAYALCIDEDPATAALASAASNGYNNDGTTNTVTLDNPPTSGDYSGDDEFSVATVHSHRDTIFAQVIGFNDLEVTSSATSRCRKSFEYGVLALTTRNDIHGLEVTGNGNLTVDGGGIMSNSTHPHGAVYDTGSGDIVAEAIHANGGVTCTGTCSPAPEGGWPVVPDPLAGLAPPDPLTLARPPVQSTPDASDPCTTPNGYAGLDVDFNGNRTITLNPGVYCGIHGDGGVNFILNPGIYYIDGPGGFVKEAGNSSTTGSEIVIYLSPTAGGVDLRGNYNVNISAPTSGPYAGMVFYADRTYTRDILMSGNLSWNAVGTFYAAGSHLDLSGNSTINTLSSMVIADTITLGGSASMTVDYDPGLNVAPPTTVSLIE
jgi:Flp pilus assembly protein TadG